MQETNTYIQKNKLMLQNHSTSIKNLETQIRQVASILQEDIKNLAKHYHSKSKRVCPSRHIEEWQDPWAAQTKGN